MFTEFWQSRSILAGDGRTGTYIALDILLEQLWKKPTINIFSCVNQLCQQRAFMVQNKIQYQFIHDILAEEILTGFSEIFVTSIPEEFKKLQTNKANGEKAMLKKQYEEFIFPLNQSHPIESYQESMYTNVEENNVFEASCKTFHESIFVDGFFMKNEFMLTLQPSKNNADMFWKLIYEKRYSIIIMLDDTPKIASVYWPQKINCTEVYGSIKVELTNTAESKTFFQRYFQVSSTKQNALEPVYVVQFQSKIWQRKQLPFPSDLIELIQTVTNSCGQGKQLLIQCKDGITKSSIFCVLCVMICKIRMNERVSILRLLRSMKKKNPQIVTDYESYKFCWSVAEILQDENSTYYSHCQSQEISEIV
ncbi:unnamed protein product [Acanthosepion pharaonis]|uniref:Protein tyrosine phosphatase n=1 Tax=Acanthosepion pharaonis TaxID=158019 RepID=A0A812DRZ0_ACAPH|nr:unnamed protein product [Sepia pharaonis]